ncbi:MAG: molybdenum cofactor guanylyltransferase, partial [Deltaproteobacteria bacterium]|nr:molybdenum cofactor guanylyltransferase [Deltaproteobacteria bacterium]
IKGVTGVILAGGKSSRFGSNKALVDVNGTRLIERVISVMRPIFKRLILVTNTPHEYSYLQLPTYEDLIKGLGPIGGIYTGLEVIEDEMGFFGACDMPFLNKALVRHILEVQGDFDAVVPRVGWKLEALHAMYTKNCLPAIIELIDAGEYKTVNFFQKVRVRYVDEDEIRSLDPQLKSFVNVNRPQELRDATGLEGMEDS